MESPMAPTPPRPRIAPDPDPDSGDDINATTEDRLFGMLHDGQVRQEQLLRDIGTKIDTQTRDTGSKLDSLTAACQQMSGKIEGQAVTPSLIKMQMVGMAVTVLLVGLAVGAQFAMSAFGISFQSAGH